MRALVHNQQIYLGLIIMLKVTGMNELSCKVKHSESHRQGIENELKSNAV